MSTVKEAILNGEAVLGIELGSTRIKAVLIDGSCKPVASGSYDWENQLENGIWTYALDEVWKGLQGSYAALKEDVKRKYGVTLTKLGAVGISAMMHGYLVFDKDGNQLVPFRTWRNTITGQASQELTELFQFNIPQRWSIAHLYQAILNKEEHVPQIDFMTTLAGYIHWKLTERGIWESERHPVCSRSILLQASSMIRCWISSRSSLLPRDTPGRSGRFCRRCRQPESRRESLPRKEQSFSILPESWKRERRFARRKATREPE